MFFQNADPGCGPKRRKFKSGMQIPETRPSILDPLLETEPWIDKCPCADTLVLFLHNHPIAVIPGSKMESVSLAMRLSEMRHRAPRHATS